MMLGSTAMLPVNRLENSGRPTGASDRASRCRGPIGIRSEHTDHATATVGDVHLVAVNRDILRLTKPRNYPRRSDII